MLKITAPFGFCRYSLYFRLLGASFMASKTPFSDLSISLHLGPQKKMLARLTFTVLFFKPLARYHFRKSICILLNLGKLVDNNSPKRTRRKQLAENNSSKILDGKLVEGQLAQNSPVEKSSQEWKIFAGKYSAN